MMFWSPRAVSWLGSDGCRYEGPGSLWVGPSSHGSDAFLGGGEAGRWRKEPVRTWRSLHLAEMLLLANAPMEASAVS